MVDREGLFPVIRNVTIFSGMQEADLRRLYDRCEIVEYQSGDVIITEGSDATEIYVILMGRVSIVIGVESEPLEIVELCAGSCIGEASVIGIQAHSASAVAREPTTLLILSRKILMALQVTNKDLFSLLILNLARELARRLHHTDEILLRYSRKR